MFLTVALPARSASTGGCKSKRSSPGLPALAASFSRSFVLRAARITFIVVHRPFFLTIINSNNSNSSNGEERADSLSVLVAAVC